MIIHDITMTIRENMQVYKNKSEKKPVLEITRDFDNSAARESRICMDMHTGTHLDMPLHFIPGGSTVDRLDLTRVVTPCRVIDLSYIEQAITAEDLKDHNLLPDETILLKTRNSQTDVFDPQFVYLASDGADFLVESGIQCVGIDGLGIERSQPEYSTHKTLLRADIIILEGLRLQDISQGYYLLVAVPLKIAGAEASPVRAMLIERDNPGKEDCENPLISL